MKLGIEPLIDETANVMQCRLGNFTEVGPRTQLAETLMDDYSYIVNDGEVIYTTIGKFCSLAAMVRINPGNHPMQRASQSHFTYRSSKYFEGAQDEDEFFNWRRSHRVEIGHDVWIGHGAVILPGRKIGTGAVIAAGSIVTKDVEPYRIVAGVPAKMIRRRFEDKIASRLLDLCWWDWPHELLHKRLKDFRALNIRDFLDKYPP